MKKSGLDFFPNNLILKQTTDKKSFIDWAIINFIIFGHKLLIIIKPIVKLLNNWFNVYNETVEFQKTTLFSGAVKMYK